MFERLVVLVLLLTVAGRLAAGQNCTAAQDAVVRYCSGVPRCEAEASDKLSAVPTNATQL